MKQLIERHFFGSHGNAVDICVEQSKKARSNKAGPVEEWLITSESELSIMGLITPFPWDESETSATEIMQGITRITSDRITVRINSMGGAVYEGIAIYSMLMQAGKPIDVIVEGMAGSVASLIMQAGDTRSVSESSSVYLHKPFSGWHGMNAEDMIKEAKILDQIEKQGAAIYAQRSGIYGEEFFHRAMADETTYTGDRILDVGLADSLRSLKNASPSNEAKPRRESRGMPKNLAHARRSRLTIT